MPAAEARAAHLRDAAASAGPRGPRRLFSAFGAHIFTGMIDPEERFFEDLQEVADSIARAIIDAQAEIERLAAETGKRQERTLGLEDNEGDHVFLSIHFICEPGQFATRKIEGDLAEVAERALGGR